MLSAIPVLSSFLLDLVENSRDQQHVVQEKRDGNGNVAPRGAPGALHQDGSCWEPSSHPRRLSLLSEPRSERCGRAGKRAGTGGAAPSQQEGSPGAPLTLGAPQLLPELTLESEPGPAGQGRVAAEGPAGRRPWLLRGRCSEHTSCNTSRVPVPLDGTPDAAWLWLTRPGPAATPSEVLLFSTVRARG